MLAAHLVSVYLSAGNLRKVVVNVKGVVTASN